MKILLIVLFLCSLLPPARAAEGAPRALTFGAILEEVKAANPELQLARRRLGLLEAEVAAGGAYPNPSVEGERSGQTNSSELKVVQPVPLGRRVSSAKASAQAELDAARKELEALQNGALAEAKKAYYAWRVAGERLLFEESNLKFAMDLLNKIEMRVQTGEAGNSDLARAKVEAARGSLHAEEASSRLNAALSALNALLGRQPDAPLALADSERFGLTPRPGKLGPYQAYAAQAAANRPELRVYGKRAEGADYALKAEKARRSPDLEVGLARGSEDGLGYTTVSLGLELPLWYSNAGGIKKAAVARDLVGLEEKRALLAVNREVYESWLALDLAGKSLVSEQETVLLLNDLRKNATLAYLSGKTDLTDYYETNRVYLEENMNYLDALLEYYEKKAGLEAAVNVPSLDSEEK